MIVSAPEHKITDVRDAIFALALFTISRVNRSMIGVDCAMVACNLLLAEHDRVLLVGQGIWRAILIVTDMTVPVSVIPSDAISANCNAILNAIKGQILRADVLH
jgi:hypothetical protein